MKIKIKVTKDILRKSMMCGVAESRGLTEDKYTSVGNCAIAVAVRDVFPNAHVYMDGILLLGQDEVPKTREDVYSTEAKPDYVHVSESTA
jgi:hypothetical protein